MTATETPTGPPTREQIRAQWDALAPGFDDVVTPTNIDLGEDVLRRVEVTEGTRFLDVAAGSGALAIPAARRGARVVATDISPVMLERLAARARAEGLVLDTRLMDGQSLQLEDDEFDVSASQHGVSLFPDIDRGLRELVRVTRPGGRVVVATIGPPQHAEFLTFFIGALKASVPGFPGLPLDPPPLPFQVADPERLRAKLVAAGLADVVVDRAEWQLRVQSGKQLWKFVVSSNPIGAQLVANLTSEQAATARTVLEGMVRERRGNRDEATLRTAVTIGLGTS